MDLLNFALTTFTAFFAIMNPIANMPIFLGLTKDRTDKEKRKISFIAIITAFFIGLAFILFGTYIFKMFGLTIPAFKIAGGVLIFYVGFEMLQSKKSNIHGHDSAAEDSYSISVSPLAIPILAGPGTLVTAMNASSHATFLHALVVVACFALILFITHLAFVYSGIIVKYMGQNIIKVIGKIMGLILSIIGVNMVIEGVKMAFGL
jgi:multiple antibiotic resistance protein